MMSFPSLRCLVALGSTLALGFVATAEAAAPMVKTPAPGFYRMMLGDFEVTALLDGTIDLPVDKYLTHTTPAKVKLGLAKAFETVPLETSVNAFLVNTGTKLILIDTGAGSLFGPTLGGLVTSLKAAGYAPDQIDEIYVTHMHGDHVGGLMANGLIVFRNATVRADQRESTHWLSDDKLKSAKDDEKEGFQAAMTSVGPYLKAGRFKPFDGAIELVPGIHSMPAYGHTPGHTVYVVESKGQKLVAWGDLMHVAAMQFDDPAVTINFDSDSVAAARERKRIFAEAAHQGYLVAGAHLQFPGLGHLRAQGAGYVFVPVNYTVVR